MSNPTTTVPTPVRKDRRGGIKSVIGDFVSAERLAVATNLQWVADNCDFPKAAIGLCYAETPVTDPKEFGGLAVGDGPIFALYAGVQCYLGNNTDYDERARAQLEAGEGRGVEEVLWEYGMSAGGAAPAQTSWVAAFAQADEAADTLYVGRPVIMVSRFVAVVARARKAIFGDDQGNLWTANGTPIIASAAASDTTLLVMGWPTVYASPLVAVTVMNPIVNQEMALAERAYGIAVDCNFALHYAVTDDGGGAGGAVTLALTTDPVGEAPVGTPVAAQVTVTGTPTEPILLYIQHNEDEPYLVGEMNSLGGGLYELDADTTGLIVGDVYGFYASHGEASAAVRSPIVTVTVVDAAPVTSLVLSADPPALLRYEEGTLTVVTDAPVTSGQVKLEKFAESGGWTASSTMRAGDDPYTFTSTLSITGQASLLRAYYMEGDVRVQSNELTVDLLPDLGVATLTVDDNQVEIGETTVYTLTVVGTPPPDAWLDRDGMPALKMNAQGGGVWTLPVVNEFSGGWGAVGTFKDEPGYLATEPRLFVWVAATPPAVLGVLTGPATFTTPGEAITLELVTDAPHADGDVFADPALGPMTFVDATHFTKTVNIYPPGGTYSAFLFADTAVRSNEVAVTQAVVADPNEGWTVGELRQFAADHEPPIPIPSGSHKAEILAIILAYLAAHDDDEEP